MFDWLKDLGSGIVNVVSGKTWNGTDPDVIKAEAEKELAEQQAQTNQLLKDSQASANSTKKMLLVALLGVGGFAGYQYFSSKNRRYGRR